MIISPPHAGSWDLASVHIIINHIYTDNTEHCHCTYAARYIDWYLYLQTCLGWNCTVYKPEIDLVIIGQCTNMYCAKLSAIVHSGTYCQ
jgi:hypothetical protein